MASLKRTARNVRPKPPSKEDICTNGVLELSVTVGYLAVDVKHSEMAKLERLLKDHTDAGLVALERGDLEQHLHFQMVCRARVKSARAFGILVRKYMDWYLVRNMCPAGKVTCKVLTNRLLHSWKGMVGYCLKDSGMTHFDCAMYCISDDEVVAGKMLHSIYGKADLKNRVLLTNKNVGERAYVWFKYKENRQLTATMLSTLTDMVNSGMFIPAASWIIPISNLGMDQRLMNSFWRCLTDPANVDRADVVDIFICKREYVKGRYTDDEVSPAMEGNVQNNSEYVFDSSPSSGVEKEAPTLKKEVIVLSSDEDSPRSKGPTLLPLKEANYIILSSDTNEDTKAGGWPKHAASVFKHRQPAKGPAEVFVDGGGSFSSYFEGPPKVTFVKTEASDN